jgi:hypothetical protein
MRGNLMRLQTREQHRNILVANPTNKAALVVYRALPGLGEVTAQNLTYWRKIFVDNAGKLATTDNQIKQERKLRKPLPDDDTGPFCPDLTEVRSCILVIPDQHMPYHHPDTIPFLRAVKRAFPIDLVVNLGDEVDHHAISFHDSDPNLDSAGVELEKAKLVLAQLYDLFPEQLVCASNHGSLAFRKAKAHGIPVQYLKSYREVLFPSHKATHWSWASHWRIPTPLGDVMFQHQSPDPTSDAAHHRCNLVVGHAHGKFEISYAASPDWLYWGGTFGCLIDNSNPAFAYGQHTKKKPIIGCGIIIEGRPVLIPMILDTEGRWVGVL